MFDLINDGIEGNQLAGKQARNKEIIKGLPNMLDQTISDVATP